MNKRAVNLNFTEVFGYLFGLVPYLVAVLPRYTKKELFIY